MGEGRVSFAREKRGNKMRENRLFPTFYLLAAVARVR